MTCSEHILSVSQSIRLLSFQPDAKKTVFASHGQL